MNVSAKERTSFVLMSAGIALCCCFVLTGCKTAGDTAAREESRGAAASEETAALEEAEAVPVERAPEPRVERETAALPEEDSVLEEAVEGILLEIGFETESAAAFVPRGGVEVLTVTGEAAHTGELSLRVENRSKPWHGPALNIAPFLTQGREYAISCWIRLISPEPTELQLSTQIGQGDGASYHTVAKQAIAVQDGWVQYTGTYRYTNISSGYITVYIESPSDAAASFYLDDLCLTELAAPPITLEALPALKARYEPYFLIGNIASNGDLQGVRFELLSRHFQVVTAENGMKPSSLQAQKGVFTFADADVLVDTFIAQGIQVHGHTLAWHQQSPEWMNYEGISREEALENLLTHAKTVAAHFKGRVISWDVLNEAINDNPQNPEDWRSALRQTPWYKAIGAEYIPLLFQAVREADPEAKLYYNDYNLDNQNKARAVYAMVKDLNDQYRDAGGRPLIDGIGMQGHYRINTNPQTVARSLELFASLGVEISITELDIQTGADSVLSESQGVQQALLYGALFTLFKEHAPSIARVTFWGLDDGSSWRASANPTLFDKNLQAKPAFYAVSAPEQFLAQHQGLMAKDARRVKALFGTPVVDGIVDPIWENAPVLPVNQYLMAWQGASGTARVLWDESALYVLVQVADSVLNKASPNAYEQDSVEVFVDEGNDKTPFFQDDDGQYRVNFANETSFNPPSCAAGFVSAVQVSGSSYTVEMKIPFKRRSSEQGAEIGFDVQINDASAQGIRQSVALWNDLSGNSFQDTSGYGILELTP
ncbi:MAG: endo-1,4-beta-xylanase [Spirochaetaceae bacterium]|jgi:endo-1,4-beta-xylanase|nr:endo-1,4-beta-xylanase [Spirochaetaceae bacterium]